MNKSLRFLAIGLALAVLLVSQVGVDRLTEAAPIEEKNDTVEFAGMIGTDDADEQQDYYRPKVTVDFYLKDPDLALPTGDRTAEIVWTLPDGENLVATAGFLLRVDGVDGGAVAPDHDASDVATSTAFTPGYGAGRVRTFDFNGEVTGSEDGVTYTANAAWGDYKGDASTPLDGTPVVTVRNAAGAGQSAVRLVTSSNPETGRFRHL